MNVAECTRVWNGKCIVYVGLGNILFIFFYFLWTSRMRFVAIFISMWPFTYCRWVRCTAKVAFFVDWDFDCLYTVLLHMHRTRILENWQRSTWALSIGQHICLAPHVESALSLSFSLSFSLHTYRVRCTAHDTTISFYLSVCVSLRQVQSMRSAAAPAAGSWVWNVFTASAFRADWRPHCLVHSKYGI